VIRTDASVVICTYTPARWDELCLAVGSVRRQSLAAREVIVVVDHHDDLYERVVAELPVDGALTNRYRRGLSGARNTGLEAASGDVVAFLDDDATADQDWLLHLLAPYAQPDVIGVGGLVVPRWSTAPPAWFPAEFGWVVGCSYEGLPVQLAAVRNPIGANMSFRRRPLAAAGGFATTVGRVGTRPVGCEETEAAIRLCRRHPKAVILHQPHAVVHHLVPAERACWRYFHQRCWSEGLSKAEVARLAGPSRALRSENRYVTRTIPRGMARDIRAVTRHGDSAGMGRVAAAVAGLAVAGSGYALGRLRSALLPHDDTTEPTEPTEKGVHP
jgi:glucosyl-dolichyl phosphate glucuronosyltransferase